MHTPWVIVIFDYRKHNKDWSFSQLCLFAYSKYIFSRAILFCVKSSACQTKLKKEKQGPILTKF